MCVSARSQLKCCVEVFQGFAEDAQTVFCKPCFQTRRNRLGSSSAPDISQTNHVNELNEIISEIFNVRGPRRGL